MMKHTSQCGDTIVEPSVLGCDVLKQIGKSRAGIVMFHHSCVFHVYFIIRASLVVWDGCLRTEEFAVLKL